MVLSFSLISLKNEWSSGNETPTVKHVYNDHLYNKIYYLWFVQ